MIRENFDTSLLHDASLLNFFLEWEKGKLTIELRFYDDQVASINLLKIIAINWITFNCPKKEEWGPSVSINQMNIKKLSKDIQHLSIEMQSGDIISIDAKEFLIIHIE